MQITSDDLYEFGRWARDHKDDLASTSAWVLIERGNVARPTNKGYSMTDEKAAKIDKAVCAVNPRIHGEQFVADSQQGIDDRLIPVFTGNSQQH